ncbi:hypothetical protein BS47DRAFT_1400563 [Hydnum rufescens UP504]|uniref:Uncharacterized protein n=1 Tax=Hydnum rufescens UP504 TaxID=1448309 RepID=A0A9P6AGN7_9AGAM|nr:hypothetical protein BS47DRAFT_1400563 [Hydnum rufescens UP504]
MQLQKQVNTKTSAPKISRQSFSTNARVLNTTEALEEIASRKEAAILEAEKRENEKHEKERKAKEARDAKARKKELAQQARAEKAHHAQMAKAEKAAARLAAKEERLRAKAETAAAQGARKSRKRKVCGIEGHGNGDKENEGSQWDSPPKQCWTLSPEHPAPNHSPYEQSHPQPRPQPRWTGPPASSTDLDNSVAPLRYMTDQTAVYPGPLPPLVNAPEDDRAPDEETAKLLLALSSGIVL